MASPSGRRAALAATVVAAVVVVLAIVVVAAPANWLARFVADRTDGVLLLADADGTVWRGSAVLAIGRPRAGDDAAAVAGARFALPGRINWTLGWGGALAPVLHLKHDDVLGAPLAVRLVDGRLVFDPDSAVVPASLLELAGAPLNTLRPDGRCELRWNALAIDRDGTVSGAGTLRVAGFALALSPVRPLGNYLVTWSSAADGFAWQVATESGPLQVDGSGRIAGPRVAARVVVKASPGAPPAVAARLAPLLDTIGRRGGGDAVVQIGAS